MNKSNLTRKNPRENKWSVSVLSLDREDQTIHNFAHFFEKAVSRGSSLVVIPFGFPTPGKKGPKAFFARLAKKHQIHLVAGFQDGEQRVAAVFSPRGDEIGRYAQTHRLPDEDFEPGNELKPVETSLGKLGLSIGTDFFFPEVHWSLAQQGADVLIHLDIERGVAGHFHFVLSPKVRAFDVHKPLIVASPTSNLIKLVHNEEMEIAGIPMTGSSIFDQNGAVLASTGFSQGIAMTDLRLDQHCQSGEQLSNMPVSKGLDVWKLYFNDSREKYFAPLRCSFSPKRKPKYQKRKIKIAILSHRYADQLGKGTEVIDRLMKEACRAKPDIIVCTEMERECRPEDPKVKCSLDRMAKMASKAGSYLLIGGIRCHKPGLPQDRASHAWLWDRTGRCVFEAVIMLYGSGCGVHTFDTDFGRIGVRLCGDAYAPEIDRLFALEDADIVFNPSMSWGASGLINTELNQVRAMDNGHYVVSAHLAFSDAGQRSHVIDPMGGVVAASSYDTEGVLVTEIDLNSKRGIFVKGEARKKIDETAYLAKYRTPATHRLLSKQEIMRLRRPELYAMIDRDLPDHAFTTRDRGDGCKLPRHWG